MSWSEIVDSRGGMFSPLLRAVFRVMSWGFRLVRSLVNSCVDHGLIKKKRVRIPVISIGNIVAGGTGKTPLIDFLAEEIQNCAVVSRGYRSKSVRKNVFVSKDMDARVCGDEPLMLCKKGHSVYVGKNRHLSAQMAEKGGACAVLLDDGMQQRWLRSDFSIAVVNGDSPFGNGFFLPRGDLRDPPKRLARADLVIVNGAENFADAERHLAPWTQAPIVGMKPEVIGVFGLDGSVNIAEKKVRVFCAIGNPKRFVKSVEKLGAQVVDNVLKRDHAHFSADELDDTDVDYLVCTEKDWVKLKRHSKKMAYVKIALTVVNNSNNMGNFLSQVRQLVLNTNGGTK